MHIKLTSTSIYHISYNHKSFLIHFISDIIPKLRLFISKILTFYFKIYIYRPPNHIRGPRNKGFNPWFGGGLFSDGVVFFTVDG